MPELLTRNQRHNRFEHFRLIGARAYRDAHGNADVARGLAGEYLEDAGYGSVWVIIGIKIIMILIEWWLTSKVTDPGDFPMIGEPGVDDVDWRDSEAADVAGWPPS